MAGSVEKKLQELGITLPKPPAPIANYVPFVRTGNLLTVSGQVCFDGDGKLVAKGQLGSAVSIDDGQKAARAHGKCVTIQMVKLGPNGKSDAAPRQCLRPYSR